MCSVILPFNNQAQDHKINVVSVIAHLFAAIGPKWEKKHLYEL